MTKAVGYAWLPEGSPGPAAGALDAQRGRIWAWCKDQGLDLEDIHAEAAGGPQGDALEAALEAAVGGCALVVDGLACLAASLPDLARTARRLHDSGTRLVCLREDIDTGADPWAAALKLLEGAAALAGTPMSPAAGSGPAALRPAFTFAEPPTPLDEPPGPPAYSEILNDDPDAGDDVPARWDDVTLEPGEGGFVDEGFDPPDDAGLPHPTADACPAEMQITLGDLGGTTSDRFPEEDWEAPGEAEPAPADDAPYHAGRGALEAVSSLEGDIASKAEDSFPDIDEVAGSLPVMPQQRAFGMGGEAMPKVRHRRESDYAVAAEKASRHVQKGRLEKAAGIWERFLAGAVGPVAGRAWNHLGDIHVRAGRPVEAIDAWMRAAQTFEASHYNNMAVATLKKVLKLDPPRAEIQRQVADLNARCDRVGDAVEAYLAYARHLKGAGRLSDALEVFARIRILDPVNARHRMQLAEELHAFGFEGEAVREALYAAELLLERGAVSEAEVHLSRWTERVPEAPELTARLAALGQGAAQASPPPAAGVEGGVLLTTGGAGRARADEPAWERGPG